MEEGKIKITRNGGGKIKFGRKQLNVPKEFDLSPWQPESGSNNLPCQFEGNNPITRIVIEGKEVGQLGAVIEDKKAKAKRKKEEEEKAKLEAKRLAEQGKRKRQSGSNAIIEDSFQLIETFLPNDVKALRDLEEVGIDNFSLKLNKAARSDNADNHTKFQFFKRERKGENYEIRANFEQQQDLFEYAQSKLLESVEKNTPFQYPLNLGVDWRMVTGLGNESVYETDIALHHIYGIPYIPGSSVKGMLRSYIVTELYGSKENIPSDEADYPLTNAEFRALTQSIEFCEIFGCPANTKAVKFKDGKPIYKKDKNGKDTDKYDYGSPEPTALQKEHQGQILFFDAFPTSAPKIEVDIMNPHYGPYYSNDNTPPADYHMPVPVPFLTVARCKFQFIIGSRNNSLEEYKIKGKPITQWLKEALTNHGIGAKTAVGYGYMSYNS